MKRFLFAIVSLLFLSIYIVSSSSDLMKVITDYRFYAENMLSSSRYRFGDLYGVSYLPDFKHEIYKEKTVVVRDTCNFPRQINLYCVCDSYLYTYHPSESDFCGVNTFRSMRWDLDDPIETELDPTKINVLLIERSERYFSTIPLPEYVNKIKFVHKHEHVTSKVTEIVRQEASTSLIDFGTMKSIYNLIFYKSINQNLEFNLFDYGIFSKLKEMKAQLNYKIFDRILDGITIIPNLPYLFMTETINPESPRSSFIPRDNGQVNDLVGILNSTYNYYLTRGFDAVCFSIVPNPVSIICPGYKPYNDIIRRVQNHPDLKMTMINIFDRLSSAPFKVYFNADSHWNTNGYTLWVNEFNKYLRTIDKEKK